MEEKKDWETSRFTKRIRITEEHYQYIKKIKKKGGLAVTLEGIIDNLIKEKYGEITSDKKEN